MSAAALLNDQHPFSGCAYPHRNLIYMLAIERSESQSPPQRDMSTDISLTVFFMLHLQVGDAVAIQAMEMEKKFRDENPDLGRKMDLRSAPKVKAMIRRMSVLYTNEDSEGRNWRF